MSRKRLKQYMLLLMAIGVIAIAMSGGGTFASFNAETTNPGNTFATGTLFLHNKVGAGTVCASEAGTLNVNGSCSVLFNVSSMKPGQTASAADLTLTNAGSIDASDVKFLSAGCTDSTPTLTTLTAAATNGNTSVTVAALPQALLKGTPIKIGTDSYTVNADAALNATSISVTPAVGAGGEANGSTVTINTSQIGSPSLCSQLQYHVVETASDFSTVDGCAYGPAACSLGSGFNTSFTLSTLPAALQALTLTSGVNGNTGTNLSAGKSRYFVIEVFAPSTLDNTAQNAKATFDLTWHIDQ